MGTGADDPALFPSLRTRARATASRASPRSGRAHPDRSCCDAAVRRGGNRFWAWRFAPAEETFQPTPESSIPITETAAPTDHPVSETTEPTPTTEPAPTADPTTPSDEPSPAPDPTEPPADGGGLPFIVTFASGTSSFAASSLVESVGGAVVSIVPELRMAMVVLPDAEAADIRSASGIGRVEADQVREVQAAPSDTHFSDQWALSRIGWETPTGSVDPATQTIVAILDTGVAAGHPDLNGRLVDGESYVDGVPADTDANGHGTWMAGIVGAAVDNEAGIAGVSWGAVRVLPITVLDSDGEGQDSDVIEGLVAAVDRGADVALLAFSSPEYSRGAAGRDRLRVGSRRRRGRCDRQRRIPCAVVSSRRPGS